MTTGGAKDEAGRCTLIAERRRLPQSLARMSRAGPLWPARWVRAARPLRNDGTYPHREIGEVLVQPGDVGCVLEIVEFCGEAYYTVEFVDRSVVVGTRDRNLIIA